MVESSPRYSTLPTSESAEARPARQSSWRWFILVGLGLLAVFYLTMSMQGAVGSMKMSAMSRHESYSSFFSRSERQTLVDENAMLKERLRRVEESLKSGDAAAMQRAQAQAAPGGFDNSFMKLLSSSKAAPAAEPTLQQTLSAALSPTTAATAPGSPAVQIGSNHTANPYALTKELIRSRCDKHNIILVTFVNSKRADYGYTWAAHLRRLGLSNYLVGAMDGQALKKLVARSIPTFDMESGLTTADYGWGTKNFRQLGLRKSELIITLLRAGADPVLTDADALITKDPSPFIARLLPEAQILVTSDHLASTTTKGDTELEVPDRAVSSAWNIGYMYLRHDVLHAMLHWQAECIAHPTLWDQNLFKDVLKIGGLRIRDAPPEVKAKRLFLGYNATIKIGILPVSTFCSGHTYFVQRMPQAMGFEPYSVHTTFQYSGAVGKTHRLREALMWDDEPSYLDPKHADGAPIGFLSYTPIIRRELSRPAGKMDVASHFALVHAQLTQLRSAFLLARRLRRLLILPTLVCGLDRFWAPHNGTIPGSDTKLPIDPCPADHVIDLERIAHFYKGTVETLVREYSFLSNPKLPETVRQSAQTVPPPADLSSELGGGSG